MYCIDVLGHVKESVDFLTAAGCGLLVIARRAHLQGTEIVLSFDSTNFHAPYPTQLMSTEIDQIRGTSFGASDYMCVFGDDNEGYTTDAVHAAPGLIECPIPPASLNVNNNSISGPSSVHLLSAVGFHSNRLAFSYYIPPTLLGMFPKFGSIDGGTRVIVTGLGFADHGGVACSFGGVKAPGDVLSGTKVACTSPAMVTSRPAGTAGQIVPILVTINGLHYGFNAGGWSEEVLYEYVEVPVISFIRPTMSPPKFSGAFSGREGFAAVDQEAPTRYLTVHGAHFLETADLACRFGAVLTTATYISSSEVQCRIPPSSTATGNAPVVSLTTNSVDFSREGAPSATFTYVPSPELLALSPRLGPVVGGTTITLLGRGFGGGATSMDQASLLCRFQLENGLTNGVDSNDRDPLPWDVQAVIESDGVATCVSPEATSVVVGRKAYASVRVSSDRSWSFSASVLRFLFYTEATVTSITPATAPASGRGDITVSGHRFLSGEGLLCVFTRTNTSADGILGGKRQNETSAGGNALDTFTIAATWLSAELIQCRAPVMEVANSIVVALDVRVTNNGVDISASAGQLLVYPQLDLFSLSPVTGPRNGGTVVNLTVEGWTLPLGIPGIGAVRCQWGSSISVPAEISVPEGGESERVIVTCISPAADVVVRTGIGPTANGGQDSEVDATVKSVINLLIDDQSASSAGLPYYYHAMQVVQAASPTAGVVTGGTEVIIKGFGFSIAVPGGRASGQAVCMFGDMKTSAIVVSDSELRCRCPPWTGMNISTTGVSVGVKVSLNGGIDFSTSSVPFNYLPIAITTGETSKTLYLALATRLIADMWSQR